MYKDGVGLNFRFLVAGIVGTAARAGFAVCTAALSLIGPAGAAEYEDWNAKFQATYVWQVKPSFPAQYSGGNSLSAERERSYSFTSGVAFGFRPWNGGELYFNPEVSQGVPLSGLTGLGGFTNGEIARTTGPELKAYRARLFLRQTWGMGGGQDLLESDANQLASMVDKRRWVVTAGNLSVLDIFDDNAYSHDPRTQFLNWALMTHGAYDYAADARGYSWGATVERYHDDWAVRFGRFIQPREPNQLPLDPAVFRHYGDQVELEHGHTIAGQPGKVRLLAFRNRAKMSRFRDALGLAGETGAAPDINLVRRSEQTKRGFGINIEQALGDDIGLFSRASWADGQTEAYAFTEIDRSLSGGVVVKGSAWGRGQDTFGMAFVRNGLSQAHRDYLAAGGLGFFIGDGRLNYRPETIFEAFYSARLIKKTWVSLDWQHIQNPAYNADRGPVNVGTIRLHMEL